MPLSFQLFSKSNFLFIPMWSSPCCPSRSLHFLLLGSLSTCKRQHVQFLLHDNNVSIHPATQTAIRISNCSASPTATDYIGKTREYIRRMFRTIYRNRGVIIPQIRHDSSACKQLELTDFKHHNLSTKDKQSAQDNVTLTNSFTFFIYNFSALIISSEDSCWLIEKNLCKYTWIKHHIEHELDTTCHMLCCSPEKECRSCSSNPLASLSEHWWHV